MLDTRTATWPEVQAAIARGCPAVLAFGAQEQHGPHCPLSTDTIMASGLAERLAERVDGLLLPPVPYGDCWNNSRFPGTISLSFETVKALAKDIALNCQRSGVPALIIVNGHFGNRAPLELVCREMKSEYGYPVLQIDYPGLERLASQICDSQPAAFSFFHADEVETSIVLALAPEAVQMDQAQAEYPDFPPTFASEQTYLDSFCSSGVFGDPRPATAEKGQRLLEGLTTAAMPVIEAFLATD
jgi:creatinine amidohydrolase